MVSPGCTLEERNTSFLGKLFEKSEISTMSQLFFRTKLKIIQNPKLLVSCNCLAEHFPSKFHFIIVIVFEIPKTLAQL
jgi:hypothetical protein